ncbi:MAG: proline dehydrogenase family protein, partial [Myxococcota bacterium]
MGSPGDRSELETHTRAVGDALLERIGSVEPRLVESSFWEERLLEVVMDRPDLKVQLFRFVDVLPALDARRAAEHLFEYLGHSRHELPAMLRWGLEVPSPEGPVARVVGRLARRNVLRMARRFIAGSNAAEAIEAIRRLRSKRLGVTLDVLGEAVLTSREADAYREQYLLLLRETAGAVRAFEEDPLVDRDHDGAPLPRVNVSLKLSALAPVFDPIDPEGARRAVAPRLRAILDAAQQQGGFVYVDMEHHDIKDLTLRVFQEVLEEPAYRRMTNVGIVLQAYLRDCERDVHDVARWARERGAPVWVRLVKGAYWDHETIVAAQRRWPVPVFEHKGETDGSFERCTDALLEHADVLRPAIASHNVRSVAHALAAARVRGLPERFLEFQTLYGMADPLKHALVALDQRVRVYTPYGELIPGMAYLVRRLLENTSNESFLRHQMSAGETAESLLAPPAPTETPKEAPMVQSAEPATSALPFANAPLQDFSDDRVRAATQEAIDRVGERVGIHCPLVLGGSEITTPEVIESVNPSQTGVRVGT